MEKIILKIKHGSHLYGTNTPTSDEDYVGVFLPNEETVFGFEKKEEIDLSIKDKLENGKNSQNAVDFKIYELRKFLKLAMENNPNILEILFVNIPNITSISDEGTQILAIKHLFPYKGLYEKFIGYSYSQKHKASIKAENFFSLEKALNWFYDYIGTNTIADLHEEQHLKKARQLLADITINMDKTIFKINNEYIKIGDLTFHRSATVKQVIASIEDRIGKQGNRKELITKYGYDNKFMSHCVRLLIEGKELLLTGNLIFPLAERETIMNIKQGKWSFDECLQYVNSLEEELEAIKDASELPAKPNYDAIQKVCIDILKSHLGKT